MPKRHVRFLLSILSFALLSASPSPSQAASVSVVGGQTSVLLDFETLEAAASLALSSISDDVVAPGSLGDSSVAFSINPRDAAAPLLPTTFAYDPADFLGSFSGVIEHSGSVFFNMDDVQVGNFSIAFDADRIGGERSGFFVSSTVGVVAPLFDVATPTELTPTASSLTLEAPLLVSGEFGAFLFMNDFSTSDLAGAEIGTARVEANAVVPEPSAALLMAMGLCAIARRRQR